MDVNFHGNTPKTWDWVADPLFFSTDQSAFYAPATQDPVVSRQIFVGYEHVYRTQDSGGDPAFLDAHCNTTGQFGTSDKLFSGQCGDFKVVSPNLANDPAYGSKAGSYISAIERAMDGNTLWVGTRRGRIFISPESQREVAQCLTDYGEPAHVELVRRYPIERLPLGEQALRLGPLQISTGRSGHIVGGLWCMIDDGSVRFQPNGAIGADIYFTVSGVNPETGADVVQLNRVSVDAPNTIDSICGWPHTYSSASRGAIAPEANTDIATGRKRRSAMVFS